MGPNLIAFVGVIYLVTGFSLIKEGKLGLGIAFLGYAFSNVGLYLAARAI
jgi:hypothetical protein